MNEPPSAGDSAVIGPGAPTESPLPHLQIVAATAADVPTILTLIRELASFEQLLHEVVATEEMLHQALFGPRRVVECSMARRDGVAIGFALYFHNFSTFLGRSGLYLEDLYVRPEFRGQGVGEALLKYLARLAMSRGCGRMEWAVLNWNKRAIAFYERFGARGIRDWTTFRLTGEALGRFADSDS